jgi:predicted DNA-binding mobile mystery protein A
MEPAVTARAMQDLQRRQLDSQLSPEARLRDIQPPSTGWLSAIRKALGMQTRQLAARLGVSPQAVSAIERSEREGSITLASLRKAADALGCDVVLAVVPRVPLVTMYSHQVVTKAGVLSASVLDTMALEAQSEGVADVVRHGEAALQEFRRTIGARLWE